MNLKEKLSKCTNLLILIALFLSLGLNAQEDNKNVEKAKSLGEAQKLYKYITVPGDPLKARVYTLENGLKVYMTVYKEKPRIQTYIAVKAGSKNDPKETTGLAHYFEHMMFKGTKSFGTRDFEREAELIAKIEELFEEYRKIPMEKKRERRALYHIIDSISYEASTYAIPNEYFKLMNIIGASGTNAGTSLEQTVYYENIPSNQIENWAKIQADRFSNSVLRLFHTELETIYEEKNMTMTSDPRKVYTATLEGLFQKHTYGTQTTIGTQEHIKNPSMKNIRWFFDNYYVPNNMAICLSGDFNPDQMIQIIDKYFGKLKAKKVPEFKFEKEDPITTPIIKEVWGPDAESVRIAYRFGGAKSSDIEKLIITDMILCNNAAGLIDLNLNQKQKVLSSNSSPMILADYSALTLSGKPKEGQTLDQVKDLLLGQIELIKKGEFADWLIPAIINDLKIDEVKQYENNSARAMAFVQTFIYGLSWEDQVKSWDKLEAITKEDIVKFANESFKDNYVVVYKRTGVDKTYKKMKKTRLTPIEINRDAQSDFYKEIKASNIPDIKPVFVDYDKEMSKLKIKKDIEVLYKKNIENETYSLYYITEMGDNHNKKLGIAIRYLEYLGTSKYTPEQIKQEFFKLGTSFSVFNSDDRVYVMLRGLSKDMEKALKLFEELLADAQPNKEALGNMISDILKKRTDAKKNGQRIFGALVNYGIYGEKSSFTNILSEKELNSLSHEELINIIKSLNSYEHKVLYYGSKEKEEVVSLLNKYHNVPEKLNPIPAETKFTELPTDKNIIYVVNHDTKQSQILMLNQSDIYNKSIIPTIRLFNDYFGTIVFQEMREKRSLAYTAMGFFQTPSELDKHHYGMSYIATQYDKMDDAMKGLISMMDEMPLAEKSFQESKDGVMKKLGTSRTTKSSVLFSYLNNQKLKLDYDIKKDVYEQIPNLTLADLKAFQTKYMSNKTRTILVLGDENEIDFTMLKKYGKVKKVKLEDIFGY